MKKNLLNERGLTLAEVLATLAVVSLIMLFIVSVYIMIQRQYDKQTSDLHQLTDVTTALKAITKDLRKASTVYVGEPDQLEINDGDITYILTDNVIKKNGADFIYKIDTNESYVKRNGDKIILKIVSQSGEKIETAIFLRE